MISQWSYDSDFDNIYQLAPGRYEALDGDNILITGATGLVGTCLTEFLVFLKLCKRVDVSITVLSSSRENLDERFGRYIADGTISACLQDIRSPLPDNSAFDHIIHAASVADPRRYQEEPADVIDITVMGTRNILECARACGARVVYVSSVEVYGDLAGVAQSVSEEVFGSLDPFAVRCSYTESKRLAETLCKAYQSQYGVSTSVARLCKVYGPSNSRSDLRVMAHILNTISRREDIVLNSDGSRVFSFCYVTDAVSAILTILTNGEAGQAYNVSDTDSVASLKEIADYSAELAGVGVQLAPCATAEISKDTVVSSTKLNQLGWSPRTGIRQGLQKQFVAKRAETAR